jgi:hypothetical protein
MLMLYYLVHTLLHGGIDVVTAIKVPTTSSAQYQRQLFKAHNRAQARRLDVVTQIKTNKHETSQAETHV